MASQAEFEPARKRQRKAKSCQPCRDRKVRCDQASPCGPCQRSRDHLRCTYRDLPHNDAALANTSPHEVVPTAAAEGLWRPAPARFAAPELVHHHHHLPAQGSGGWTTLNTPHSNPSASNGVAPAYAGTYVAARSHEGAQSGFQDARIQELEERVRRLEYEAAAHSRSLQHFHTDEQAADNNAARNETKIDAIAPRLRITTEKAKLFGPSHWVYTAEKVYKFGSFDAAVEPVLGFDKKEWSRICTELRKVRRAVKLLQQPANVEVPLQASQLVDTLPPRQICGVLLSNYQRTFESVHRVIHVPQFCEEYEQFWRRGVDSSHQPTFILKLVLILAIGVPFLSNSQADVDANTGLDLRRQARQWIYAAQWWLAGPTEKCTSNLDALQIFCLALTARQVNGLGNSPSLSANSLASLAVQMGLNRNPRTMLPGSSRCQVECMSRLWSTVTELLLESYLESGLPLPEIFDSDVEKPSNLDDRELKDGHDISPLPISEARTTDTSIHLLLLKSQKLRIQALRVINSTETHISYETAMDLANQLKSACTEVTKFFNERKSDFSANANFPRKYIDMYLRKHILLLHRPFMLEAHKDPRFYLSHKMCVESAMIMASYTDVIKLPSEITDDFAKLMVQGSGHMRGGLSLDVAMTLALELNTSLQEEDGHGDDDPARVISRAFRRPFLRRLTHIRDQLFQIIELGIPSMRRFLMVSSFLAQFQALEAGANAKAAFFDAAQQNSHACMESLQKYLDTHTPQASDASSAEPSSDYMEFNFGNPDFDNLLDPLMLFDPIVWSGNAHLNIGF